MTFRTISISAPNLFDHFPNFHSFFYPLRWHPTSLGSKPQLTADTVRDPVQVSEKTHAYSSIERDILPFWLHRCSTPVFDLLCALVHLYRRHHPLSPRSTPSDHFQFPLLATQARPSAANKPTLCLPPLRARCPPLRPPPMHPWILSPAAQMAPCRPSFVRPRSVYRVPPPRDPIPR